MRFTYVSNSDSEGIHPTFGNSLAMAFVGLLFAVVDTTITIANANEIGGEVREGNGNTECLTYHGGIFSLSCNFTWSDYYNANDFILLKASEIFNGGDFTIDLNGLPTPWDGLFRIDPTVESADAPEIHHLHIIHGETSEGGGFFIQADQNNFVVDSCSSSGTIRGVCGDEGCFGGGGICGHDCSGTISIVSSLSTGDMEGRHTGGIAGSRFGADGGQATIINCWSEGDIEGTRNGGICGALGGQNGGSVTITKSHSKGKINGEGSGGICGWAAGHTEGYVEISECYTHGEINAKNGGGITGEWTAVRSGHVNISNCYTLGDIAGAPNCLHAIRSM